MVPGVEKSEIVLKLYESRLLMTFFFYYSSVEVSILTGHYVLIDFPITAGLTVVQLLITGLY